MIETEYVSAVQFADRFERTAGAGMDVFLAASTVLPGMVSTC